ncbi:MAG TPA: hypothetical protein VE826_12215 [Dongiaceae bacterium]|nr:hypothetical protein [Dongiaceae bacterium]
MALALTAPAFASGDPQSRIAGTVADFHGKYGLVVRDARGALTEVTLHQGTVIKPEGLRLERGMAVSIVGHAADRAFAANEIVAPFAQWPTARAAAFASRPQPGDRSPDNRALTPGRAGDPGRWSESPDQFSLPTVREPLNPH